MIDSGGDRRRVLPRATLSIGFYHASCDGFPLMSCLIKMRESKKMEAEKNGFCEFSVDDDKDDTK